MLSLGRKTLLLSMTPLVVLTPPALQFFIELYTPVFAQDDGDASAAQVKVVDQAGQKAAARKAWLIKKAALTRVAAAKAAKLKAAKLEAAKIEASTAAQPVAAATSPPINSSVTIASPTAPAAPKSPSAVTNTATATRRPNRAKQALVPPAAAVQTAAVQATPAQAQSQSQSQAPAQLNASMQTNQANLALPVDTPVKRMPMAGSQAAKDAARSQDAALLAPAADSNQATAADPAAPKPKPHPQPHYALLKQAQHEAATKSGAGDYLGAIAAWTKFTQHGNTRIAKDMSQAYLERARLKRHIGDYTGALQDLDLAVQAEPRNVGNLLERAAIKRRQGDNQGALKDLDQAIAIDPHKADPFVDRGWLKMAMGDYIGSYSDYHAAITINPNLKNKLSGMAQPQVSGRIDTDPTGSHEIEFNNSEFKHVEKHQTTQLVPHPSLSAPNLSQAALVHLNNTAVKQINEGQFEAAIKTLTYLLSSAPDYHHALENLCIAHNNWGLELAKRTPTEAASQFRLALYLDPSQGASRRNLDAMLREVGKNPRQADVRLALCRELLASGQKEEAFVEATESLKLKNDSGTRNVMRQVLSSIDEDDSHLADTEKQSTQKPVASQPTSITDSANVVIDHARSLSASGQHVVAEDLLVRLISDIKARAAVEESGDVGILEKALAAIADVYKKAGDSYQAQKYRIELASLKETLNSSKDSQAPTSPAAVLSSPAGN